MHIQTPTSNKAKSAFAMFLILVSLTALLLPTETVLANTNGEVDLTQTVEVGSQAESDFLKRLYEKYPDSRQQLDEYRKTASGLPYGTKIEIHIHVQDGKAEINWVEIGVGAAAGLVATLIWNAVGGEMLCAVGFLPMCACVGPQC